MTRRRLAWQALKVLSQKLYTTKVTTFHKGCWAYAWQIPQTQPSNVWQAWKKTLTQTQVKRKFESLTLGAGRETMMVMMMVMMLNPARGHWQSPEARSSKGRVQWRRDWWSWGSSRLPRPRRWRTVDSFVGRCTGWATCSGGQRCGHTCNHGRRDIGDIGFSSGNTGRQAVKGTLRIVIVSWWSGCRFLWGWLLWWL